MMIHDMELLREYSDRRSDDAFATLVERHIGLVYSSALRQVRDPHLAEEITQAVFIILAQKAGSISPKTILPGWLYRTTRFTAANLLRTEFNRHRREQEAQMESPVNTSASDAAWQEMAPLLDEAMNRLGPSDREALLLRYFGGKSLREVGAALGANEDAARKRVSRGLEKLRHFFVKKGVSSTTAIIANSITSHSVLPVPPAVIKTTTTVALAHGAAASPSIITLTRGALKIMAWSKAKAAIVIGAGILLAGGTTTAILEKAVSTRDSGIYEEIFRHPDSSSAANLDKAPPILIIRPAQDRNRAGGIWTGKGKCVFDNATPKELISWAYDGVGTRMVLPGQMPSGAFDYLNTLPHRQQIPALQQRLKEEFGLSAHNETRDMDVQELGIRDPALLNSHLSKKGSQNVYRTGDNNTQYFHLEHVNLNDVAQAMEAFMDIPIIDKTGSPKKYDFEFQWPARMTGRSDLPAHLRAAVEACGLELASDRQPLKVLVVTRE
jgi:uncharacterized protein (TIGR03435 family)